MGILSDLTGPADLRKLDRTQLDELVGEIRRFLIDSVCRTGGHLGPNLGVVEVTIALHRTFDSPRTPIVFDTGHQTYVHKLLTGRQRDFAGLRMAGGISGYPNRAESVHDIIENSHASTALAYADGLSNAYQLAGEDRAVVAVIGDGALTGGLAWEGLNNLGASDRPVIVVLNDNGRSYSPTVGALPAHLQCLRDRHDYATVTAHLGGTAVGAPRGGYDGIFTALGFDYLGPVDGHDINALEKALSAAQERRGPVVVHCVTRKGLGYAPAEADTADHLHSVGVVDVATGHSAQPKAAGTWTDAFAAELLRLGERHPSLVAISAAMLGPTGLQRFADRFPARCFDVGIAEQHAITSAAGLAMGGAHPVVALYATFAARAYDQLLHDVALHRLPVTLALDRAGITGPDGPSHHGMWDLAMLGTIPGMRVAAPRDGQSLAEELREAVEHGDGPTALRFPKSTLTPPIPAREHYEGLDLLRVPPRPSVLMIAIGATASIAIAAADLLEADGFTCTVADPRWVVPVNPALADLADEHQLVVTIEDGIRAGGIGSHITDLLAATGTDVPVTALGLPTQFIGHGTRTELLRQYGLDEDCVAAATRAAYNTRVTRRRHAGSDLHAAIG